MFVYFQVQTNSLGWPLSWFLGKVKNHWIYIISWFWECSQNVWYWLKPYLRLLSIESNYFPKIGNVNGFSFRKHNQSPLDLSRPKRLRGLMWWWPSTPDWRESSGAQPLTFFLMKTSRWCSPASTRITMMKCWTDLTMFLWNTYTR